MLCRKKLNWCTIILFFILLLSFSIISVDASAIDEREPNDSMLTANTIKIGDTIYGDTEVKNMGVYDQNDDWFKFTPPVSGTAKVTYSADSFTKSEWSEVYCGAFDSNENCLAYGWDEVRTSSSKTITFPVKYGKTYYLKVFGTNGSGIYTNVSYHFTTGYSIGKTTINKVKAGKKKFTVNWTKKSKASFYQVQYIKKSVYDDYGWNKAKTVKVSNKNKSKTIKKLAKKKKYYVRVRVARTIAGKTYYSAWSPKKSVKTK